MKNTQSTAKDTGETKTSSGKSCYTIPSDLARQVEFWHNQYLQAMERYNWALDTYNDMRVLLDTPHEAKYHSDRPAHDTDELQISSNSSQSGFIIALDLAGQVEYWKNKYLQALDWHHWALNLYNDVLVHFNTQSDAKRHRDQVFNLSIIKQNRHE